MTRYVPIDLHRHRSVVMQMTAEGEALGWTRLANDPDALVAEVLKDAGADDVEVAIEATYGWYWAVDALEAAGVNVHLAAPSRLSAFESRRVKNDQLDCQVLGDLLRSNMLPEAWISTSEVRESRSSRIDPGAIHASGRRPIRNRSASSSASSQSVLTRRCS